MIIKSKKMRKLAIQLISFGKFQSKDHFFAVGTYGHKLSKMV
jgi:hypothetical protein